MNGGTYRWKGRHVTSIIYMWSQRKLFFNAWNDNVHLSLPVTQTRSICEMSYCNAVYVSTLVERESNWLILPTFSPALHDNKLLLLPSSGSRFTLCTSPIYQFFGMVRHCLLLSNWKCSPCSCHSKALQGCFWESCAAANCNYCHFKHICLLQWSMKSHMEDLKYEVHAN